MKQIPKKGHLPTPVSSFFSCPPPPLLCSLRSIFLPVSLSSSRWADEVCEGTVGKCIANACQCQTYSFSCDYRLSQFTAKGPRKRLLQHGARKSHRCGRESKMKEFAKEACEHKELGSFFFTAQLKFQLPSTVASTHMSSVLSGRHLVVHIFGSDHCGSTSSQHRRAATPDCGSWLLRDCW